MMKKRIFTLLAIIWIITIFLFSNSTSNNSNKLSYEVVNHLITITNKLHLTNIEEQERYLVIKKINKPIRKLAHMTEYFILAFLVFHILNFYHIKTNKYLLTFLFCFLYSMTDEYHQLMIEGRTGQFIDCLIDSAGCLIYLISHYFFEKMKRK